MRRCALCRRWIFSLRILRRGGVYHKACWYRADCPPASSRGEA